MAKTSTKLWLKLSVVLVREKAWLTGEANVGVCHDKKITYSLHVKPKIESIIMPRLNLLDVLRKVAFG